jgi:hypothetical protein
VWACQCTPQSQTAPAPAGLQPQQQEGTAGTAWGGSIVGRQHPGLASSTGMRGKQGRQADQQAARRLDDSLVATAVPTCAVPPPGLASFTGLRGKLGHQRQAGSLQLDELSPALFHPQEVTLPSVSTPRQCPSPAATCSSNISREGRARAIKQRHHVSALTGRTA